MIATLITLALAFTWLMRETNWLHIRLESTEYQRAHKTIAESSSDRTTGFEPENVGLTPTSATKTTETLTKPAIPARQPVKIDPAPQDETATPYYWKSPDDRQANLMLCRNNGRCPNTAKCKKTERWTYWKLPAKTIKAFGGTLNLNEGCNIQRALFLKSMAREVNRKTAMKVQTAKRQTCFIEDVRTGSHTEHVVAEYEVNGKHPEWTRIVEDYKTVYHDCLVSGEWLKAHEHDLDDYEPTIELSVEDKTLSIDGNYKKGMIGDFMSQYTTRARVGRKVVNLDVGIADTRK